MTLSLRGDVFANTTFYGACASGNSICTVTAEPKFRKYNFLTLGLAASATLTGSAPSDISFIAPASCIVGYSGSSQFDIIDINTQNVLHITTNAAATYQTSTQQVAANVNTNMALATRASQGQLTLVGLATAQTLSPAALNTAYARCICVRPDNGNWMVGTSNGKIFEINALGTVLNTITLPTTPNISSPTINVYGISFSYPNVAAATDTGTVFVYNWITQTFLYKFMCSDGLPVLCAASSGVTLLGKRENTGNNAGCPISEVYMEQTYPITEDIYFNETNSIVYSLNIENTLNYAVGCFGSSNLLQLRVWNMLPTSKTFVNTQIQNPPGTAVSGRIIRLRDNGIGTKVVEIDQSVTAGNNSVQCTNGRNYIEIGLNSGNTLFDIREFQA
jgi:hypothetical protein